MKIGKKKDLGEMKQRLQKFIMFIERKWGLPFPLSYFIIHHCPIKLGWNVCLALRMLGQDEEVDI